MTPTLSLSEAAERLINDMPTPELQQIAEHALQGERLQTTEGEYLFRTPHEDAVTKLADLYRATFFGNRVYYAHTLFIHPTNLCELSCPLCSFYAKPGWEKAWFLTPKQIAEKVRSAYEREKIGEVHFVGGLWRDCDLDYYQEAFGYIQEISPSIHIKALTAVEYDFLAKLHNLPVEEVFRRMQAWGLSSLTGGGAEVLVEEIRKKLAPQKITSDEYLDIHRRAHKAGLTSNITMLFGHIEEDHHLVTHLDRVRQLQDETGGLRSFIPLKFHTENNALGKRKQRLKPKNLHKVYAVSRLMLDNIDRVKVLWNYLGIEEAVALLQGGGNDLAATQVDEKVIKMAGGMEFQMTREKLRELILEINREPIEAHSGYTNKEG